MQQAFLAIFFTEDMIIALSELIDLALGLIDPIGFVLSGTFYFFEGVGVGQGFCNFTGIFGALINRIHKTIDFAERSPDAVS